MYRGGSRTLIYMSDGIFSLLLSFYEAIPTVTTPIFLSKYQYISLYIYGRFHAQEKSYFFLITC